MRHCHARRHLFLCFLFIMSVALISGCANFRTADIEQDTLSGDKEFTSIIYWHVRIIDRTGMLKGASPRFYISSYDEVQKKYVRCDEGSYWTVNVPFVSLAKAVGGWKVENGVPVLDYTFFKKAKPGRYMMDRIEIITDWSYNSGGERYDYINLYVDKDVQITPGYAHYLGSFDIDMQKYQDRVYQYTFNINSTDEGTKNYYALFREHYPNLAEQFKGNVLKTYFLPIQARTCNRSYWTEDFSANGRKWATSPDDPSYTMSFDSGKYVVETKNDNYSSSVIKAYIPVSYMQPDCNIDLVSSWQSGKDNVPFGFKIGLGNKAYCFFATRNGKAAIYEISGDRYSPATEWIDCGAGKNGEDVRHTLELARGRAAYFVNGKYIGTVTGGLFSRLVEEVYLGVVVGGKQKVAFKRLEVSYLEE